MTRFARPETEARTAREGWGRPTDHTTRKRRMSLLRGALKTGIALKALQVIKREASKPENQRKIKEMIGRFNDQRRTQTR